MSLGMESDFSIQCFKAAWLVKIMTFNQVRLPEEFDIHMVFENLFYDKSQSELVLGLNIKFDFWPHAKHLHFKRSSLVNWSDKFYTPILI